MSNGACMLKLPIVSLGSGIEIRLELSAMICSFGYTFGDIAIHFVTSQTKDAL